MQPGLLQEGKARENQGRRKAPFMSPGCQKLGGPHSFLSVVSVAWWPSLELAYMRPSLSSCGLFPTPMDKDGPMAARFGFLLGASANRHTAASVLVALGFDASVFTPESGQSTAASSTVADGVAGHCTPHLIAPS